MATNIVIDTFKANVLKNAEKTKTAWAKGENLWTNRHSDLMMIPYLVTYNGANREELEAFIEKAYEI